MAFSAGGQYVPRSENSEIVYLESVMLCKPGMLGRQPSSVRAFVIRTSSPAVTENRSLDHSSVTHPIIRRYKEIYAFRLAAWTTSATVTSSGSCQSLSLGLSTSAASQNCGIKHVEGAFC